LYAFLMFLNDDSLKTDRDVDLSDTIENYCTA